MRKVFFVNICILRRMNVLMYFQGNIGLETLSLFNICILRRMNVFNVFSGNIGLETLSLFLLAVYKIIIKMELALLEKKQLKI